MCGSSIDIYLAALKLCIMVDGEGHFRDHRESTLYKQHSVDDRFNKNALKKGVKVLRLHFKDVGIYQQIICIAVQRCRRGIYGRIDFSKSYNPEVRTLWRLPTLDHPSC